MPDITALKIKILQLADHCVKCGLCSTQCPTYQLKQDENESPRGRIALAQALASDAVPAGEKISTHLNNCLQCRQCESSCPSEVQYGELITYTSELLYLKSNRPFLTRKIVHFISKLNHRNWQTLTLLWQLLARSGLFNLLRINQTGRRFFSYLPLPANNSNKIQTIKQNQKNGPIVHLFTGCMSHIFDKQSLKSSIDLLSHCGYTVKIPNEQTCCGAIASRQGLTELNQQCELSNSQAFSDPDNHPIVFFTTGCGGKLKEYQKHSSSEKNFSNRVIDITAFLRHSKLFAQLKFRTLEKKILIFNPCSERNVLKQTGVVEKLLKIIPGISLVTLPKSNGCCGASGSHFLTRSQQANQIRAPILSAIIALAPDIIVSPNYPCSLHIQAGLNEKDLDIPIMHPLELLFNQVTAQ